MLYSANEAPLILTDLEVAINPKISEFLDTQEIDNAINKSIFLHNFTNFVAKKLLIAAGNAMSSDVQSVRKITIEENVLFVGEHVEQDVRSTLYQLHKMQS